MSIGRTLLRPIAYLAGIHARSQAKGFLAAHRRTAAGQQELLLRLLAAHAESDFGRDHGFGSIRTYEDFVRAVPIRPYEGFEPYIRRVLEGQTTALLPAGQDVLMFSMTSGTTGRPKYIPVTARFAAEAKAGFNIFGVRMLDDHRKLWLRQILQITSPLRECDSPRGLPCGAISGLLARQQKAIVRRMYAAPPMAPTIANPAARFYTILRFTIDCDVSFITTANPSSTLKLIETGQEHVERLVRDIRDGTFTPPAPVDGAVTACRSFRPDKALARRVEEGLRRDGQLRPGHFWNVGVLCNWTGGTLHLYLRRLRELFDGIPIRDIGLLASEGRFSIPIRDDTPEGLADICSNFLEFIPAGDYGRADARALRADELEVGAEYYLVFSNWSGLFRYNLDDCVRVTGKYGDSPIFEFLHRGRHTASITGEKITEHQVVEAMRAAVAACSCSIEQFTLQGRFAGVPYYRLALEGETADRAAALAAAMDAELSRLNVEYKSKRSSGRLGPIRAQVLPPGAILEAERQKVLSRRGRMEQYKHQYLLTDVVDETEKKAVGNRQ